METLAGGLHVLPPEKGSDKLATYGEARDSDALTPADQMQYRTSNVHELQDAREDLQLRSY